MRDTGPIAGYNPIIQLKAMNNTTGYIILYYIIYIWNKKILLCFVWGKSCACEHHWNSYYSSRFHFECRRQFRPAVIGDGILRSYSRIFLKLYGQDGWAQISLAPGGEEQFPLLSFCKVVEDVLCPVDAETKLRYVNTLISTPHLGQILVMPKWDQ